MIINFLNKTIKFGLCYKMLKKLGSCWCLKEDGKSFLTFLPMFKPRKIIVI